MKTEYYEREIDLIDMQGCVGENSLASSICFPFMRPDLELCEQAPEEKGKGSIRMWEDAPMTVFSRELADWDGTGYGPLVTCPSVRTSLPFSSSVLS